MNESRSVVSLFLKVPSAFQIDNFLVDLILAVGNSGNARHNAQRCQVGRYSGQWFAACPFEQPLGGGDWPRQNRLAVQEPGEVVGQSIATCRLKSIPSP